MIRFSTLLPSLCFIAFAFAFTSCVSTKKVTYFNNLPDTTLYSGSEGIEPVIQKGDLLSITVSSLSPEVTSVFNAPNTTASPYSSGNAVIQPTGYLVNQEGNINFPLLGEMKVAGLTKRSLVDAITSKLVEKKLLFDPIVNIRYLNFHVTVLGEVKNPGMLVIPNEEVTLLEAIGMAGDITIYGKKENVLLLRKENGKKIVRRLNLNSESVLSSPYYYLKSNDVIYVEPGKNKVADVSRSRQLVPILLSGLSFLAIITDRIILKR